MKGKSVLHAMDPMLKVAALAAITFAALALPFAYAALLFPLALGIMLLSKETPESFSWKTIAATSGIVFAVRFLFPMGAAQEPLIAAYNALYVAGMLLLIECFVKTTNPIALARRLAAIGLPERIGWMLALALQSLPLFQEKARRIRIAQESRGSGSAIGALAPLLHSAFKKAESMSLALEAKGFSDE